jgi:hypothetical protein
MSTQLITLLAIHVYLAFAVSLFYYRALLDMVRKYPVSSLRLKSNLVLASVSALLIWISGKYTLEEYFAGGLGFVTSDSVTNLIPLLSLLQQILFYGVALVGIFTLVVIFQYGKEFTNTEHTLVWKMLFVLSSFGAISGAVLIFLGILVP